MKKMTRLFRHILGVTLLEIMLVLAIAALIIVMSVRYFQSASTSQQATALMSQIQAIGAAMNSMSKGTSDYSGLTSASVASIIPGGGLIPPWGGSAITVNAANTKQGTFEIDIPNVPPGVCNLVAGELVSSTGWTAAPCTAGAVTPSWAVTYNANTAIGGSTT